MARVLVGGADVNSELVRHGAVWVYRQYNRDRGLPVLEEQARTARPGSSSSVSGARSGFAGSSAGGTGYSCSERKSCRQMTSCAEARFQLEQCDNSRLDGNGDGVPRESLCR